VSIFGFAKGAFEELDDIVAPPVSGGPACVDASR
jgi:hypothetical protein